jgi:hypothetical protein
MNGCTANEANSLLVIGRMIAEAMKVDVLVMDKYLSSKPDGFAYQEMAEAAVIFAKACQGVRKSTERKV